MTHVPSPMILPGSWIREDQPVHRNSISGDHAAVVPEVGTPEVTGTPNEEKQRSPAPDEDRELAKAVVIENYNDHRDKTRGRALTEDRVYILSFTRMGKDWLGVVCSTLVRSFRWFVTYDDDKKTVTIDVYQKVNSRVKHIG